MTSLERFLERTPKVELHLHLVGSASLDTIARLAAEHPEHGVPADRDQLAAWFAFTDFPHFIEVYGAVTSLVQSAEDIATLISGAASDLAAQRVRYVEMTVTPYMHTVRGMPYREVLDGLDAGHRVARELGVDVAWIYDIPGEHGQAGARATLDVALGDPPDHLVGFGLAGAEAGAHRADFAWAFDAARAAGLRSVPHAGEGDGPSSIWAALDALRAERIGHGVRAVEDDALVARLVADQVPLEVCPSSNVCTRVFPTIEEHSIGALLDAGVFVTVNTDDPHMFGTTLTDEYRRVAAAFGLSVTDTAELVKNAIRASFLPDARKQALLADVDDAVGLAIGA